MIIFFRWRSPHVVAVTGLIRDSRNCSGLLVGRAVIAYRGRLIVLVPAVAMVATVIGDRRGVVREPTGGCRVGLHGCTGSRVRLRPTGPELTHLIIGVPILRRPEMLRGLMVARFSGGRKFGGR